MKTDTAVTMDSIEAFAQALWEEERSGCTVGQYIHDVKDFYSFLPTDKQLDKETVIRYKKDLQERYHTPSTINTKLCAVNKFLSYLERYDCRVRAIKVQRKMFRDPSRELSHGEYMRLLNAAKQKRSRRLFLLMETICSCGLRVSELRFVTVEGVKSNCVEVTAKGKTRRIFLPEKLRKELLRFAQKHGIHAGPVFVSRNGNPLDRSNIWHEMKALCATAGVEAGKVFPHNLRHLFARSFYAAEKDLARLADILGHASVETTRIYTLSSGREYERTISALHLVI